MKRKYCPIFNQFMFSIFILFLFISMPFGTTFQANNVSSTDVLFRICFSEPEMMITNDRFTISSFETDNTIEIENISLPVKPLRLLLPKGKMMDEITVEITNPISIETHNFNQKDLIKNHEFITHAKTEKDVFEFVGCYWICGYPVVFLNLYPVFYEFENEQFYYYKEINVYISTQTADYSPVIRNKSTDYESIYSIVDNKEMISSYSLFQLTTQSDTLDYLIITNETLADSPLEDNFDYFTYHKEQQGISTNVVTVEEILSDPAYGVNGTWGDNNPLNPFYQTAITHNFSLFDDAQARIRNYIRYAYAKFGVTYVLLAGDADVNNPDQNIIPVRGLFANESGLPLINKSMRMGEEEDDIPSDVYYACLDGNFNTDMDAHFGESPDRNQLTGVDEADLLSEVSVGRACVDSFEEIAYFVEKTLRYESLNDDLYLDKILFVGEYLGFPGISAYGGNYKDEMKPLLPDTFNLVTLYDRDMAMNWDKQDLIDIINDAPPH
ncbi:MAG: hypothetical protein KGY67_04650, partial [Candidatus Thermoplasmatota archaeon]|nr:hypothetical protein [Candidatus Thermoplasmatota archaeon]